MRYQKIGVSSYIHIKVEYKNGTKHNQINGSSRNEFFCCFCFVVFFFLCFIWFEQKFTKGILSSPVPSLKSTKVCTLYCWNKRIEKNNCFDYSENIYNVVVCLVFFFFIRSLFICCVFGGDWAGRVKGFWCGVCVKHIGLFANCFYMRYRQDE